MLLSFRPCTSLPACIRRNSCNGRKLPLLIKCRSSSGSSGSSSSSQQQGTSKDSLQKQLDQAIATEDYVSAAAIKEQIRELDLLDPLYGLSLALEQAVEEERYEVHTASCQCPL